jgi:FMN phosphatase YigB (HAD superfamily)
VIVWDLGYVCFAPKKLNMAWSIGLPSLIYHKITGGGDIKKKMFDFLTKTFGKQDPINPNDPKRSWTYVMGDGFILPKIWCDHMKGALSGKEVLEQAYPKMESYFTCESERNLVKSLMEHIFNPETFAQHMYPIDETAKLMKELMSDGSNSCMVLSNFGSDAFDAIYNNENSEPIFKHVPPENIIVSGHVGMLKPHANIYEHLKNKLIAQDERFADAQFLEKECIFIDDQIENVIAARMAGITTYHFDGDSKELRKKLKKRGFLPETSDKIRSRL